MSDILTFTKPETRWLSNMTYVNIYHNGIMYPSTENFYQAMKYDKDDCIFSYLHGKLIPVRDYIATLNPYQAKKFSKENKMTNSLFEDNKIAIMLFAQREKFKKEPFRTLLLDTGDCLIEEGNWWKDYFWGVDINTRQGENNLGKLIMQVRNELRMNSEVLRG